MLLQDACAGTEETFSQQDIQRMIGILKTNGMKLEPHGPEKGISGVGLYPIYCLLNHSCYSNTNYVKFPDYHLELRSQVPIKRGEEISTRYISATIGMYRKCEVQGHTGSNFFLIVVARAISNSSKNHTFLVCRI